MKAASNAEAGPSPARPYSFRLRRKAKQPEPTPKFRTAVRQTTRGVRRVVTGAGRYAKNIAIATPALVRAYLAVRRTKKGAKGVRRGGRKTGTAIRRAPRRIARKIGSKVRR